jgi:serine/threonine-protein kinase
MAPEQARGEPLTPRCDVFALGVVLYELITGQHPLGQRITPDERDSGPIRIAPPRIVNPSVPAGLDAICMKALADNARDRYARMQHLVDALIDERFANQWREGASDLAHVIREITPGAGGTSTGPRTQITDRPVTIMTRSLISQSHRASSPRVVVEESVETLESPSLSTGARTSMVEMPSAARTSQVELVSAAPTPMIETPSAARTSQVELVSPAPAPVAPALPYGLSPALLPSPELASVHGGATVTGAPALDLRETRTNKWPLVVFGAAALIGVIAALAIKLSPSHDAEPQAAETPTPTERVQMTATVEPSVEPAVQPAAPMPTVPESQPQLQPQAPPVETAPVEPVPVVKTTPRKARSAPARKSSGNVDATLRVNTYEGTWAWASVAGQKQYANGAKFKLPAGRYTVRLSNPDLHLAQACTVSVTSGQVVTLKVDLEEGACDVY